LRAPESYIHWVNKHVGFNPRSQTNSDALSDFVVADLRESCPALRAALDKGELASLKNPNVQTKVAQRSIDLVLHEGGVGPKISVRLAVEHKTIMTAHGKARKNRYGDIIAYSNHVHNHRQDCIAGAIVVVNVSPTYENPDAFAKGLERPKFKMEKVVTDTIRIFSSIPLRDNPDEPSDQPEALGVIVVDYDGVSPAKLVTGSLAPRQSDPVSYESFVKRICRLYQRRFSAR
jgi:hypothetical protein